MKHNFEQTITNYEILVQEKGAASPLIKDVVIFKDKAKKTARGMKSKTNRVFLLEVVSKRKRIKF